MSDNNEQYFGSVKFFKNMLLLAIVLIIAALAGLAAYYRCQMRKIGRELEICSGRLTEEQKKSLEKVDAEGPEYSKLYPDFHAPKEIAATDYKAHTVYLTFDDGPSANTLQLLDLLDQRKVKATFFVTSAGADDNAKKIMKEIVARGHTIGMHTYSHNYKKIYSSVEEFLDDMNKIFELIKEATGVTPTVFRFAGGSINSYNTGLHNKMLAEMVRRGFTPHDWNLSGGDAEQNYTPEQLAENIIGNSEGVMRPVILLHDSADKTNTVAATDEIISYYKEGEYAFDKITAETKPVLFNSK